jgi:acetyltransferase-like isoleucine patch superfamily enzyme
MINDLQPLFIKRLHGKIEHWYSAHFIAPHFESLGTNSTMMKPWNIKAHGRHINIGKNVHIITAKDRNVSFSTWQFENYQGHITVGDNCLICPGVRLDSGSSLIIGNNCMLAAGTYITDADWHDLYDRTQTVGVTEEVILEDNVWIGDGATVCKGVTIGKNSVIGAGALVATNIPANSVAAGNPAKVIRQLDPDRELTSRAKLFEDTAALNKKIDDINRYTLHSNTFFGWIRSMLFPKRGD